jgi:hypothetical protein
MRTVYTHTTHTHTYTQAASPPSNPPTATASPTWACPASTHAVLGWGAWASGLEKWPPSWPVVWIQRSWQPQEVQAMLLLAVGMRASRQVTFWGMKGGAVEVAQHV